MKHALESEICIWGAGLVGYSLATYLARKGRRCLLIDICADRVERINSGHPPFEYPVDFILPLPAEATRNLRACGTGDCALSETHSVHFLCIPTAIMDEISPGPLQEVVSKLSLRPRSQPLYLLIESTVSPNWLDTIVHATFQRAGWVHKRDYHVGCSPRRDVFGQQDRTLANVAKIYGADSEECAELMREIYNPICKDLHQASSAKHAVLTKIIENLFRYQAILFANQLTRLMPEFDIAEVLSLAGTKWNMDHYHPSLGIGGYCVPLAKEYLAASLNEDGRSFLEATGRCEPFLALSFMQRMLEIWPMRKVAILGLSYASGLKVHTLAPSLRLIDFLRSNHCEIKVHDPYYTANEIQALTQSCAINFARDLPTVDTVILMTAHEQYVGDRQQEIAQYLSPHSCVFDNTGKWSSRSFPDQVRYVQIGGRGFYNA